MYHVSDSSILSQLVNCTVGKIKKERVQGVLGNDYQFVKKEMVSISITSRVNG